MKKTFLIFLTFFIFVVIFYAQDSRAAELASKLKGRILLQVESHGEAWYINPLNNLRYYMSDGNAAFQLMKNLGVGITNDNLKKIAVAGTNLSGDVDSDKDGLSDSIEDALGIDKTKADSDGDGYNDKDEVVNGYNPLGAGKNNIDLKFSQSQAGKILLQVEGKGEAWYVNPINNKRYFLGRPGDAYNLMRSLGLGITNSNLILIKEANKPLEPCNSFECLNDLVKTCVKDSSATISYSTQGMLMEGLKYQNKDLFTLKGKDNQGLCVIEDKSLEKYIEIDEKFSQVVVSEYSSEEEIALSDLIKTLKESGSSVNEINSAIKNFSSAMSAATISTCSGLSDNLISYLANLKTGDLGDLSCSLSTETGSTCTFNGNVTCVSPVVSIDINE